MTQLNIVKPRWNHSEQAGFKPTADGKAGLARPCLALVSAAAQAMSYCLSSESEFLSESHYDLEHATVFMASTRSSGGTSVL